MAKQIRVKYVRVAIISIIIVLIAVIGLLLLQLWENRHNGFEDYVPEDETVSYGGVEYELRENVETFLVMGLDKFEGEIVNDSYNNDQQADLILLMVFDNEAQKCSVIHINRDTMATMNILGVAGNKIGTVVSQIALSHTYGNGREVSCRNVADSVSDLLMGINVDHYISLTMDSVAVINDLVGGVEVVVLDDFSSVNDSLIQGQTVTLKGEQALTYVRSRRGLDDSTNLNRMKRQQQYINALYEKLKQSIDADEEFIVEASLELSDYIVSDRSVTQLQTLSEKFGEYEFLGIKDIAGQSKVGEQFMEFYPSEDSIKETVIELFYKPNK